MTRTSTFGTSRREGHNASAFYARDLAQIPVPPHRVIHQSPVRDRLFCRSSEIMTELPDNCVDLMITSPPYHVGKVYDSSTTFDAYLEMLERVFRETYRVLKPGGRAVVNVANLGRKPYIPLSHIITSQLSRIGFLMRAEIIWQKARGANGSCAWGSWCSPANPTIRDIHEYLLVFSKDQWRHSGPGPGVTSADISAENFLASTLSIWEIPPESAKRIGHPAPFPVELPRRCIALFTYPGDLVLDPFIGSGTTAVAAKQLNRGYLGYDTNPDYLALAAERLL